MTDPEKPFPTEVSTAPLNSIDTDLLAIPIFEDDDLQGLPGLDEASGSDVTRAIASREFRARPFDLYLTRLLDKDWRTSRVALVGAGRRDAWSLDRLRKVASTAGLAARQRRMARVAVVDRGGLDGAQSAQAIAEGLVLSDFDPGRYKTKDREDHQLRATQIVTPVDGPTLRAAAARGSILGHSSNLARELANEPGNVLTPAIFAERAADVARAAGVAVEILDEYAIANLGMGMLLGVARGSAEPPRLMVLRHDPPGAPPSPVLGLIGKGVTFDTGGISIKPADGMERMKDDMAGGAAVVGAMRALALLGAPIRVIGVVPTTENMPDGRAIKPGDILTSASGKTVEVTNTDAEGRLILGDALW